MFLYKLVFCSDHAHFTSFIESNDSGPYEADKMQDSKDRCKAAFDSSNSNNGTSDDRKHRETCENEVQDPI